VYDERNNNIKEKYNKDRYNKFRFKIYVMKKQEKNKNINNEEVENSFKVKKYEFDYYVMKEFNYYAVNSNINFYEVDVYNQKKKKKSEINFVVISVTMIQCYDCHQIFNFRNSLFHQFHFETVKITCCLTDRTLQSIIMMIKSIIMSVKFSDELSKVILTSNFIKDTETDYDFQN